MSTRDMRVGDRPIFLLWYRVRMVVPGIEIVQINIHTIHPIPPLVTNPSRNSAIKNSQTASAVLVEAFLSDICSPPSFSCVEILHDLLIVHNFGFSCPQSHPLHLAKKL